MPTTNLTLDGDVTTGWEVPSGPPHFSKINEGTTSPNDTDFIQTKVLGAVDEFTLSDSPGNTSQGTALTVNYRARIDDPSRATIHRLELFHSGGTPVSGNPQDVTVEDLGGPGITKTVSKVWSGLTLTKAQCDSLTLRVTKLQRS